MYPTEYRYTKEHEWMTLKATRNIGITDYAQHELGDVVLRGDAQGGRKD